MNKEIIRPLCLELEDAKNEIFAIINSASKKRHIPFYLLESIVSEAARQVSEYAKIERENAAKKYEQELEEQLRKDENE